MKITMIFIAVVLFSSLAYCQPAKGVQKEEAIRKAEAVAASSNPPMNSNMRTAYAIYMPNENAWIVNFVDQSDTDSEDSDFMVRVEASSGNTPRIIPGSQKERYRSYFKDATTPS